MVKIHFITFGNNCYINSSKRLKKEAEDFGIFDTVNSYTNEDLKKDYEFWKHHGDFILNNHRGGGYWLWKSYLILQRMKQIENDDILFYCDAGCELKKSGIKRMQEYIEIVKNSKYGILNFELPYLEDEYTKMDTILELDALHLSKTKQLISGAIIIKKCEHSIKVIKEWFKYNSIYHLVNDTPSKAPNVDYFVAHRHDQSIFSILCKKYGSEIIKDETWPFDDINWDTNMPIWATRKK
jgi:hypothetical protein